MKKVISALLIMLVFSLTLCSCSFFVKEVEEVSLSETNLSMTVGDSKTIEAQIVPEDAEDKRLVWSSSDNNIVTVNDGIVNAMNAGSAVITAKTENGVTASCNVTVKMKTITGITLNKSATSVKVGSTIQLEAEVTPVDAPKGNLKWSSSDSAVATVNSEGYVTGIKAGVVNIICKSSNDIEASCTVTVKSGADTVEPATKATEAVDTDTASNANVNTNTNSNANSNSNGNSNANTAVNNSNNTSNNSNSASGTVFPYSSSRKLTDSEVSSKLSSMSGYSPSGSYAQDAINEIYARNGYIFKKTNLRNYYESQSWYHPDSSFSYSDFNSIEKYNIKLLENYR